MKKIHQIGLTTVAVTVMAITPILNLAGPIPSAKIISLATSSVVEQRAAHEKRLEFLANLYGISEAELKAQLNKDSKA